MQSKVDKINGAFQNLNLKGEIADRSLSFVKSSHGVIKQIEEMKEFMGNLTPSLSNTVVAILVSRITSQPDFMNLNIENPKDA